MCGCARAYVCVSLFHYGNVHIFLWLSAARLWCSCIFLCVLACSLACVSLCMLLMHSCLCLALYALVRRVSMLVMNYCQTSLFVCLSLLACTVSLFPHDCV
eukprot:GDKI01027540.1.p1 GENE.GDKI01027540.1~~GDKI01027540.1.p1  ORF type:complete len:101 (-),score=9.70 GDKI01027540.1:216-518(-)